jgi:transposase-like protein
MPITHTLTCPHCQSDNLFKFGFAPDGRQRYRCKTCGKQHRENRRSNAYSEEEKDIIIKATQERSSLRGIQRTFGVDRHTVSGWIKKRQINSQT